jgi:hypothetical protein
MTATIALTTAGITQMATDLYTAAKWKYVGWGTGAAAPAIANTALGAEVEAARSPAGTITNPSAGVYKCVATQTATATSNGQTITEAGLFDTTGTGTGVLLIRGTFTGIVVATGDSIQLTFQLTFVAGTA